MKLSLELRNWALPEGQLKWTTEILKWRLDVLDNLVGICHAFRDRKLRIIIHSIRFYLSGFGVLGAAR